MLQLVYQPRPFIREGVLVYRNGPTGVADAFQATRAAHLEPQHAPEVAHYRSTAPADSALWKDLLHTPSISATGTTRGGNKVVVYWHLPNHYSNHEHIRDAVLYDTLRNGAGPLPQAEFQRYVDGNGITDKRGIRRAWVIDYHTLRNAPRGPLSLDAALEHPQTIPFIGSEYGARAYLTAYKTAHNTANIAVWYDDDFDQSTARARLLRFGCGMDDLLGDDDMDGDGQFLGAERRPTSGTLSE